MPYAPDAHADRHLSTNQPLFRGPTNEFRQRSVCQSPDSFEFKFQEMPKLVNFSSYRRKRILNFFHLYFLVVDVLSDGAVNDPDSYVGHDELANVEHLKQQRSICS